MAEEVNAAAKVAPPSKAADAAGVQGSGSRDGQVKVEVGALLRSPDDAALADPTVYQADVVEGAEATTEKPAEGAAEASPAAPAAGATEAPAAAAEAAPADAAAAPASPATAAAPAAAGSPTPPEGGAEAAKSPAGAAPGATDATAVPTAAPAAAAGVTTSAGAATGSPTPTKDPYAIDIPLDKKINKRTQRKLWEEIEKRKPLVPKHVAQHIQKYAKPPFETWGCKFRGKGSCSGCK